MQCIVVGYMQSNPIGSVTIVSNAIIVWNNCSDSEACTILSSCSSSVQCKVASPSVSIIRSCCFDICHNLLCSYIRAYNTQIRECYNRQRFHCNSNIGSLSTIVIVGYIHMISSCLQRSYCYNICIIWSSHSRV